MIRAIRALSAAFLRGPARHLGPAISRADRFLFRRTGGRWKISGSLVPSLMLYTTGAKTGLRRETPLMCFPHPDGGWLVGASNWGRQAHPAWSANLLANPDAEVHYRRRLIPVCARLLTGAETEAIWPLLERQWPHYRDYEKTAHRAIRVFTLTPRDEP